MCGVLIRAAYEKTCLTCPVIDFTVSGVRGPVNSQISQVDGLPDCREPEIGRNPIEL